MGPIEIDEVMDEIAEALKVIPGLTIYPEPADSLVPPAAEVLYPEIEYDAAFARGLDTAEGGIIVSVSRVDSRAARAAIARYVSGSGPYSVHRALHQRKLDGDWVSCSYARVLNAYGTNHTVADIPLLSYRFDLEIVGPGDS